MSSSLPTRKRLRLLKRSTRCLPTTRTCGILTLVTLFALLEVELAFLIESVVLSFYSTSPVTIHGLGVAINKVVDIANRVLQTHIGSVQVSVHTSSVPLVDDYEPLAVDLPPISQIRLSSAIHVTLTPVALATFQPR